MKEKKKKLIKCDSLSLSNSIIDYSNELDMLCLSDLVSTYDELREKKGLPEKRLEWFFNNKDIVEYVAQILYLENQIDNKEIFLNQAQDFGTIKSLKFIGQYKVTGRGENKTIYCNPYIFFAVTKWLYCEFKDQVIDWFGNKVVVDRIEAGSEYNIICDAVKDKILPKCKKSNSIFTDFVDLLNAKILENSKTNSIDKEGFKRLNDLQIELSTLINVGHIKDYKGAKKYLKL